MRTLDDVIREVAESNTVTDSVLAFIGGLKGQIQQAGLDQAKLDAIVADLDAQQTRLAAAIVENTPAAEPPPAPPAA